MSQFPPDGCGMKTCPFCAETVKAAAVKCRYCGSALVVDAAAGPAAMAGDAPHGTAPMLSLTPSPRVKHPPGVLPVQGWAVSQPAGMPFPPPHCRSWFWIAIAGGVVLAALAVLVVVLLASGSSSRGSGALDEEQSQRANEQSTSVYCCNFPGHVCGVLGGALPVGSPCQCSMSMTLPGRYVPIVIPFPGQQEVCL